jgi:hypothetical protein
VNQQREAEQREARDDAGEIVGRIVKETEINAS